MRWAALFRKALMESVRDWKILILTVTFAPFFVFLMYFYTAGGQVVYRFAVVNGDSGRAGATLIARMSGRAGADSVGPAAAPGVSRGGADSAPPRPSSPDAGLGKVVIRVREVADSAAGIRLLEDRAADLLVLIPPGFSAALERTGRGGEAPTVTSYGDPSNVRYLIAAAYSDYLTYEYAAHVTGIPSPVLLDPRTIRPARRLDDFALYVPALLGLAVMMLMFTAAAPLIREKDKGTLVRLRMSSMTAFEWLSAVTVVQLMIGLATVALSYATALALGYRGSGSTVALLVVSAASCLAVVGISVLVAAFLRTIFDLATIGCFPFFAMMFFSGGMFPLPDVTLATVAGVTVHANDVLPTTHTIAALGKVLSLGKGLGDVAGELAAILALAAVYFALGTWTFTARHMRAR